MPTVHVYPGMAEMVKAMDHGSQEDGDAAFAKFQEWFAEVLSTKLCPGDLVAFPNEHTGETGECDLLEASALVH